MASLLTVLLANLGLIAIFMAIWVASLDWTLDLSHRARTAVMTLLAACASFALIALPLEVEPGVRFDLRNVPIALCGMFVGPVAAFVTAAAVIVLRIAIGGAGVPAAAFGAIAAGLLGAAAHRMLRGRLPQRRDVLLLAVAVALCSVIAGFLLPVEVWPVVFMRVSALRGIIVFAATAAMGIVLVSELRRRIAERENRLYRAVFDLLPEPLNARDTEGRLLAANPATATLMRAPSAAALIGKTDFDFYPAEVAAGFRKDDEAAMRSRRSTVIEQHVGRHDGSDAWLSTLKAPLFGDRGEVTGLITHNRDVTEEKRRAAAHAETQRRLDDALTNMADGVVMYDKDLRIVLCNDRYREFFPLTAHVRVAGSTLDEVLRATIATGEQLGVPPDGEETWIAEAKEMLRRPSERLFELRDGRWLHGRARPTADGGALVVISDVTAARAAERKLAELNAQLSVLARDDGLTGLVNRRTFEEALQQEVERSIRSGAPLSLLMLDLDNFKAYNDTYGHPAGDECLRRIAAALGASVRRAGDLAARYGGEEFAVILPETDSPAALAKADAIRRAVRDLAIEHTGTGRGIVTVSIGVATRSGREPDTRQALIGRADRALYAAKAAGRDRVMGDDRRPPEPLRAVH